MLTLIASVSLLVAAHQEDAKAEVAKLCRQICEAPSYAFEIRPETKGGAGRGGPNSGAAGSVQGHYHQGKPVEFVRGEHLRIYRQGDRICYRQKGDYEVLSREDAEAVATSGDNMKKAMARMLSLPLLHEFLVNAEAGFESAACDRKGEQKTYEVTLSPALAEQLSGSGQKEAEYSGALVVQVDGERIDSVTLKLTVKNSHRDKVSVVQRDFEYRLSRWNEVDFEVPTEVETLLKPAGP